MQGIISTAIQYLSSLSGSHTILSFSWREIRLVRQPISIGSSEKVLKESHKCFKEYSMPMPGGRVDRLFRDTWRRPNFERLPISFGILVNKLSSRSRTRSLRMPPISGGKRSIFLLISDENYDENQKIPYFLTSRERVTM